MNKQARATERAELVFGCIPPKFLACFRESCPIRFDKYLLLFEVQQNCIADSKTQMASGQNLRT